jgi:hypothetical protein
VQHTTNNMKKTTELKLENLVKLNQQELEKFSEGRLLYVDHPTKGVRTVDTRATYVNTFGKNMTEEEKKLFH